MKDEKVERKWKKKKRKKLIFFFGSESMILYHICSNFVLSGWMPSRDLVSSIAELHEVYIEIINLYQYFISTKNYGFGIRGEEVEVLWVRAKIRDESIEIKHFNTWRVIQ